MQFRLSVVMMQKLKSLRVFFLFTFIPFLLDGKCLSKSQDNEDLIIETKYGQIKGFVTDKSQVFLGIPYADPPERWVDATEPSAWNGTIYNATRTPPMCFQPDCPYENDCVDEMSEDCLYLNIFAPPGTTPSDNKAVMVWIHGGYFVSYTGSAPIFSGEQFVNTGDVVLVTINYRLGAFGFLVTSTKEGLPRGNNGIRDQRLALKWVNENIHGFGGNPNKVTVFGESAGAYSVMVHLMTEKSRKYFHQAIIQSPPLGIQFKSHSDALKQGKKISKSLGCSPDDVACFRSKTAEEILEAQMSLTTLTVNIFDTFMPWGPFVDGTDIKSGAVEAAKASVLPNIPLMIGTTMDETVDIVYRTIPITVPSFAFKLLIGMWKPLKLKSILEKYSPLNNLDTRPELVALSSDFLITCPTRLVATSTALDKTWMYIFNQPLPIPNEKSKTPSCATHACHAAELPYVFNSFQKLNMAENDGDIKLANKMVIYWTNFAKNGDPNGNSVPQWSNYISLGTNEKSLLMFSSKNSHCVGGFKEKICDFWNDVGY